MGLFESTRPYCFEETSLRAVELDILSLHNFYMITRIIEALVLILNSGQLAIFYDSKHIL